MPNTLTTTFDATRCASATWAAIIASICFLVPTLIVRVQPWALLLAWVRTRRHFFESAWGSTSIAACSPLMIFFMCDVCDVAFGIENS